MPKETLPALERDAERLLFAGAQVARGDADLEARRQKLAPLAPKAPALAKIVEQIEKVQKAPGKGVASELLNLSALMAQVRGAQAAPAAPAGDLAPLPPSEPIESPLSPTELSSLVNALTVSGKARPKIVADAVERDAVRDLRLLPFCVSALNDPAVGHVVERDLLPKLGKLVVPELLATLRVENGKELDAKKLRVLAAIQGQEAKPLLALATQKGTPELRKAGVGELGELDPAMAEPIALRLLREDRSTEVRKAAAQALGGGTRDDALDALLAAFTGDKDLRRAAGYALARLVHPRTTERALALLTPERLALANLKLPKADTPAKKKANDALEREHAEKVAFLSAVLDLLASRKDKKDTVDAVLAVFRDHKVKEVKNAAARALLKSGYQGAFDELAPSVYDADWETRDEFIDGILDHDAAHAFERLGRFLDPASLTTKNKVAFAEHILNTLEGRSGPDEEPEDEAAAEAAEEQEAAAEAPSALAGDPRWTDAAIRLLGHKELSNEALDLLSKVRSDKAREAAIAFAASKGRGHVQPWRLLQVLKRHRDPRVPPLLMGFLDTMTGYWARKSVLAALREYDDPALAPALKAWGSGKRKLDKREKEALDETVQFLERDRTLSTGA
jgi:hypothetical protein